MLDGEKLSIVADWLLGSVADAVWDEDDGVLEQPELWGVEQLGADGVMLRLVVKTTPSQQ